MAAMAPPLSSDLRGECPDCGAAITVAFEPRPYCLRELRDRARFVYADVDLLASRYHWAEDSILAMPNRRRQTYVELALERGGLRWRNPPHFARLAPPARAAAGAMRRHG